MTLPLAAAAKPRPVLMNMARLGRGTIPIVISQVNIRPVFDVHADVQGRDLESACGGDRQSHRRRRPAGSADASLTLAGQIQTMRESFNGLFAAWRWRSCWYFSMVIKFQSWIDPLIVLMAVPFALAGVMWMLYLTGTHMSVPA